MGKELEGASAFQDLGDATLTIRNLDDIGPSGIAQLVPDDDGDHLGALEEIREVLEENYGEQLDKLTDDDEKLIVERAVLRSDELPHIEYRVVDEV